MPPSLLAWINEVGLWMEWLAGHPKPPKKDDALRFGILGAANIAPQALIIPAWSHAEVIVAAVAARDVERAQKYAKKYDIPIVHKTYDDLVNDPSLDAIYNPLPNGLHFEWTLKALKAGKHVLLEKPATSNAEEAHALFNHSVLSSPNAPIVLEARHYQFHPAWSTFLSLFNPADVVSADATAATPDIFFSPDDIRFKYDLAGGSLLDLGTYTLSALRGIFRTSPVSVDSASPHIMPQPYDQQCDTGMRATYTFPGARAATMSCDLCKRVDKNKGTWWAWLFHGWPDFTADGLPPTCSVRLREMNGVEGDVQITTQKEVVLRNFMAPHLGHGIEINTTTTYRSSGGKVLRTEKTTEKKKAYTWPKGEGKGEDWWPTYRHMLEAFVDRVKGREGSGCWIGGEESIAQMESIDKTYDAAGMALRPTSKSCKDLAGH